MLLELRLPHEPRIEVENPGSGPTRPSLAYVMPSIGTVTTIVPGNAWVLLACWANMLNTAKNLDRRGQPVNSAKPAKFTEAEGRFLPDFLRKSLIPCDLEPHAALESNCLAKERSGEKPADAGYENKERSEEHTSELQSH